jgi:hypothetical protein
MTIRKRADIILSSSVIVILVSQGSSNSWNDLVDSGGTMLVGDLKDNFKYF